MERRVHQRAAAPRTASIRSAPPDRARSPPRPDWCWGSKPACARRVASRTRRQRGGDAARRASVSGL